MPRRRLRLLFPLLVGVATFLATAATVVASPSQTTRTGDVAHDDGLQWAFDRIGAAEAWDIGRGEGITIAVIDSGVALDHEDLVGQLVPGADCLHTEGDPARCDGNGADDNGHGTHVAGIAAAVAGNGIGIAGIAPDAKIMPLKVLFGACETCPSSGNALDVVAAIRWAVANGADIINLSLGSTASHVFGPSFREAIRDAWDAGAIPVVAAGNDDVLTAEFGDSPAVVVAATDRFDGSPSYASGIGAVRWAVAAPGGDRGDTPSTCAQGGSPVGILSTYWSPGDTAAYACLSGTSMATPHVSGALAVLLSAGLTPTEAINLLLDTAIDVGEAGHDERFGRGLIDLEAAAAVVRAGRPFPTDTPEASTDDRGEVAGAEAPDGDSSPPSDSVPSPIEPPSSVPVPVTLSGLDESAVGATHWSTTSVPAGLALLAIVLVAVTAASAITVAQHADVRAQVTDVVDRWPGSRSTR